MKGLVCGCALAIVDATAAMAQAPPNIVGFWKSNGDMAAARRSNGPFFQSDKPRLYKNETIISYRIDMQDEHLFAGVVTGPEGREAPLVGVFHSDGKTFMFSDAVGSGMGSVETGVMQTCLSDTLPNSETTACGTFKR